jgi:hypothetical protein
MVAGVPKPAYDRPRVSELAKWVGKSERSLRRLFATRPAIRKVAGAQRAKNGKWELSWRRPEFAARAKAVLDALEADPGTRRRRDPIAVKFSAAFGLGNPRREIAVKILRAAMKLRRMQEKLRRMREPCDTDDQAWEDDANAIAIRARSIAGEKKCEITETPKFWIEALAGTSGRAEAEDSYRKMQLLWPLVDDFRRATLERKALWRKQALAKAARELRKDGIAITGRNLALRLARTEALQEAWWAWRRDQELIQREAKRLGIASEQFFHAPPPKDPCKISLREFRRRYNVTDVRDARGGEGYPVPDPNSPEVRSIEAENGEVSLRRRPRPSRHPQSKERGEILESAKALTPEDRKGIEKHVGSLDEYAKDPTREPTGWLLRRRRPQI